MARKISFHLILNTSKVTFFLTSATFYFHIHQIKPGLITHHFMVNYELFYYLTLYIYFLFGMYSVIILNRAVGQLINWQLTSLL